MFDSRFSGFAFKTTKIKMGKNESAPSSLWRCLNRPKHGQTEGPRERKRRSVESRPAKERVTGGISDRR